MYLKEKTIKLLQIKNVIFAIIGVFNLLVSGLYIISEFVYYRDDLDSALHAKSMTSSIVWVIISIILLIAAAISRNRINDAAFYSSYFEGDLDGYVRYADLAEVTGKSLKKVKRQLHSYLKFYMKNYELKEKNREEIVELYSKKCTCECRNCGAHIEKRIFFTSICPYCGSSDLFAKVLTNDRFYSISNDFKSGVKNPDFYKSRNLSVKKVLFVILLILGLSVAAIALMMALSTIPHYFDREYQEKILLSPENHLYSYELIKADILDTIILAATLFLVFTPLALLRFRKTISVYAADICADFLSKCKAPFAKVKTLPDLGAVSDEKKKLKKVRDAIRRRYLLHCTLEVHEDILTIALAKKIVKDQCPSCGAPIVDAVDENYVCKYCSNLIMGVIEKK